MTQAKSKDQVRRYIRLTHLIPELLSMVDENKIAFNPAVELSYLSHSEQLILLDAIKQKRLHTLSCAKHTVKEVVTGGDTQP